MSLITGNVFVSNDEYVAWKEASGYLLQYVYLDEQFALANKADLIDPYQQIVTDYLLSQFPELQPAYQEICACKSPKEAVSIFEKYRSTLPQSYTIYPVPANTYVFKRT